MSIGLLGQKIGMTSVYDANGRLHPVTVIAAGDNVLLARLTNENNGYSAIQVGFATQKLVREFRLKADLPDGEVNLSVTQFQPGDFVDVIGRSKGKGFQGVMKKHNFDGQGAAHGSKTHRRNGAVGNRSTPGRIWKNMGMPGHMGDERVTVQNLQVMQVREAEKVILISGAVPGCNGSYVMVRPAIKNPAAQIRLHQQHAKQDKAIAKKHEAEKKAEEKKPEAAKKPEAEKKPEAAEKK